MKDSFSKKIKYLGFIMTCAMVLYHCPIVETIPAVSSLDLSVKTMVDSIFRSSVSLIMSYFFAVTSFLLFRDFRMEDYPAKIKRRVFSLLIPYILWQIIVALIEVFVRHTPLTMSDFLQRSFLLYTWPVDAPLWYVYVIFLLALLSPALLLILKRKNLAWLIFLGVFFIAAIRSKINIPVFQKVIQHGYVEIILYYLPAYLAGAFYGYHYKDSSPGCLYYVLFAQILAFLFNERFDNSFAYICIVLLPITLLYILPPVPVLENRKIYKLSFLMYAIHRPVLEWLWTPAMVLYTNTVGRLTMYASVAAVVSRVVLLAVVAGIAALIYYLLSKLSPRVLALLTGGRA